MFLDNSITLTKAQYEMAVLINDSLAKILTQASPNDDTPLTISLGEVLELAGQELLGKLGKNSQPAPPKK